MTSHHLLFACFDNSLPPCFILLLAVLKGKAPMLLLVVTLGLLEGSGVFTHLCFLASSTELWHMLFTLNKYLLIERRIISISA